MANRRIKIAPRAFGIILGSVIAGVSLASTADEKPGGGSAPAGKFVAPGQMLNFPKTVPTLSHDGVVITHLFEELSVEVGVKSGSPEADARCASVRSTLAKHDKPVYIHQTLKGTATLQPGVEGVVLFQSCGKTTLVPLPKSGSGDFEAQVVGAVQSGPDYLATICLLTQRSSRDREVKGLIVVDSLELKVVDSPKSK